MIGQSRKGERGGVETGVKRSKGRINVFPWQPRQKKESIEVAPLEVLARVCVWSPSYCRENASPAPELSLPSIHNTREAGRNREEQGGAGSGGHEVKDVT